jgi:hypothetical protein
MTDGAAIGAGVDQSFPMASGTILRGDALSAMTETAQDSVGSLS